MTSSKPERISWLRSYATFSSHFFHMFYVLRGVLGTQVVIVLLGGAVVARSEGISTWDGIYFALITATSVGYGDIVPSSTFAQIISVILALIGTVFFGLVAAVATRAVTATIHEYVDVHSDSLLASGERQQ